MYEICLANFHYNVKFKDPEPEKICKEMILLADEFKSRVCLWHEEVAWRSRWLRADGRVSFTRIPCIGLIFLKMSPRVLSLTEMEMRSLAFIP